MVQIHPDPPIPLVLISTHRSPAGRSAPLSLMPETSRCEQLFSCRMTPAPQCRMLIWCQLCDLSAEVSVERLWHSLRLLRASGFRKVVGFLLRGFIDMRWSLVTMLCALWFTSCGGPEPASLESSSQPERSAGEARMAALEWQLAKAAERVQWPEMVTDSSRL